MYIIIITGNMESLGGRNQYIFLDDRAWSKEDLEVWLEENKKTRDIYNLGRDEDLRLCCVKCCSENKGFIESAWT